MSAALTPRRDFLARLAAAAAAAPLAAAATACASAAGAAGAGGASQQASAGATPAPAPRRPPASPTVFDDTWTARVTAAKHKAVFDAPEVNDGVPLFQAALYRQGYKQALGAEAKDVVPVIVLRHRATPLALDDALWAKYPVARVAGIKPSDAKKKDPFPAVNPYARPHTEAEKEWGDYLLAGLLGAGVVVLACNNAFLGYTARLAREAGVDAEALRAEARAGLMPGVLLQPSGVYATLRAQEVGCTFMRS